MGSYVRVSAHNEHGQFRYCWQSKDPTLSKTRLGIEEVLRERWGDKDSVHKT